MARSQMGGTHVHSVTEQDLVGTDCIPGILPDPEYPSGYLAGKEGKKIKL